MKIWIPILLLIVLCGCKGTGGIPEAQSASAAYLENKGFRVLSYEGRAGSYQLTRQKLAVLPQMLYWVKRRWTITPNNLALLSPLHNGIDR